MEQRFKSLSLFEFQDRFKTSEDCLIYLSNLKWKGGFVCKKCGHTHSCVGNAPHSRQCTSCRYVESPTAQTLFHQVKFDLLKAFYLAFFLNFIHCTSPRKIVFENRIDTTNKPITIQEKKIFKLDSVGVFASNNFDTARLNDFKLLNDSTAIAIINPENSPINNSPYYAFNIWSKESKSFYINFKYPKGFKHRYLPKLKINDKWKEIDSSNIFIKDSLTFIKLNLTQNKQIVAAQKIESSKDVHYWIQNLIEKNKGRIQYKSIGKSELGKNLPVLIINKGITKNKNVIVLLTRQHPPETTGYYAFQYFLEAILEKTKLSKTFLNNYQILAFPIMNPDGVDLGHWRHNANGVDLNRDWSVYNQPEIKQTVKFITKYAKKHRSKIVLGLDFHSTWYDVFYTNEKRIGTTLPYFIEDWFNGIEENIHNYSIKESANNSTKPVSKGWFLNYFNAVGITFEIGDETLDKDINKISQIAALQMMRILLTKK